MFRKTGKSGGGSYTSILSKEIENIFKSEEWVRPIEWPSLPIINVGAEKAAMLFFISRAQKFVRFTVTDAVTIDWGDGTILNYPGGLTPSSQFFYERAYDYDLIDSPEVVVSNIACKLIVVTVEPQVPGTFKFFRCQASNCIDMTISGAELTTISVANSGVYSIEIVGATKVTNFTSFFSRCSWLREVRGELIITGATSTYNMFVGCRNLLHAPMLDLSTVTDMATMFMWCSRMLTVPNYNTSNVTNFYGVFRECKSLSIVPALDYSSAANLAYLFNECNSLVEIPDLNSTNAVTDTNSMFRECFGLITVPYLEMSGVTNASNMFYNSGVFEIPEWIGNMPNVTNANGMFQFCENLIKCADLTLLSATNVSYLFNECPSLKEAPLMIFGEIKPSLMNSMFNGCEALEYIPSLPTSNNTNFYAMFDDCKALRELPSDFSLGIATNISNVFYDSGIVKIPEETTLSDGVTSFQNVFGLCTYLEEIPAFDLSNITSYNGAFSALANLSRFRAYGMKKSFELTTNDRMDVNALVELFENLADLTGFPSETLKCNYSLGWSDLTDEQKNIALNKNWTLVG